MTQKIIICILFLVTVSSVNISRAGQLQFKMTTGMHIEKTDVQQQASKGSHSKMPVSSSHPGDAHHGKAARVPHMEELPHIHRYHRERVRKQVLHSKIWFLSKFLIVVCHLSLLWIAYLHLTH